jgi:hypothetical protein
MIRLVPGLSVALATLSLLGFLAARGARPIETPLASPASGACLDEPVKLPEPVAASCDDAVALGGAR